MTTLTAVAAGGVWGTAATWSPAQIPTNADDCVLASTSGNVTIAAAALCRSLDCTGYTGTLTHNTNVTATIGSNAGTVNPSGVALKLVPGMTYTQVNGGSAFSFNSTASAVQTIDFGGKATIQSSMTFASANGAANWQLVSTLTASSATVAHTGGTLDLNGQTVSLLAFTSSGAITRSLAMGASSVTVSATNAAWSISGSSVSVSPGTSTITLTATSPNFTGGGLAYNNVVFSGAVVGPTITDPNTFNNLTATASAVKTDTFKFTDSQTITGTLTLNGNSAVNRLLVQSSVLGTPVTLTCGAVSFSNADFQDIVGAGAANWNLSAITGLSGDCGGNSGITFTAPTTQTSTGTASFVWSTHGWTSHAPLPQDDVSIPNAFIAGRTVTMDMPRLGKNISFTCTGNPAGTLSAIAAFYGNLTLATGMTTTTANNLTFGGRGSQTITTNGVSIAWAVLLNTPTGTYTLQDNCTAASGMNLTQGTLDLNGKTCNCSIVTNAGTLTRQIAFSGGTLNLTAVSGSTVWNATGSGYTSSGTGVIAVSTTSTLTRTFAGGGFSYPTLTYTVAGSTGTLTITGSNTFAGINFSDASNARSLLFTAGTTNTFTNFNVQGTSGKLMTIDSVTAAAHTLSCAAGTISSDYLSVKNSHAGGGASWYAGANSTDATGNTGWIFTAAPLNLGGSGLLLMGIG